jgi:hypothetical protein
MDGSFCATTTSNYVYETEEECWADLEVGYRALVERGVVVIDAVCYYWDNPYFDEES